MFFLHAGDTLLFGEFETDWEDAVDVTKDYRRDNKLCIIFGKTKKCYIQVVMFKKLNRSQLIASR